MTMLKLVESIVPDFCWVSAFDIVLMCEQINEDINEDSVKQMIHRLKKRGILATKPDLHPVKNGRGAVPFLYLKVLSGVTVKDAA